MLLKCSAAEDANNAQQVVEKDQRVTCKTANSLPLCPFRPNDPINLGTEVLDQNRLPIGRHLPNLSGIQPELGEASVQERPVFPRRIQWRPGARDQTKTTYILQGI